MTREEAINNIKELQDTYITSRGEEDTVAVSLDGFDIEALDMAIKALEQEPTTKNDLGVDCISRQAVLEQAYAYGNGLEPDGYCVNVEDIQALPSVTPQEPRKGHWKLVQRGKLIDVCCSNCEAVRIKGYAYNYTIDELNKEDINECFGSAEMSYCPNCGAKMESEG